MQNQFGVVFVHCAGDHRMRRAEAGGGQPAVCSRADTGGDGRRGEAIDFDGSATAAEIKRGATKT
jgi:hypothetical protein